MGDVPLYVLKIVLGTQSGSRDSKWYMVSKWFSGLEVVHGLKMVLGTQKRTCRFRTHEFISYKVI